MICFHLCFSMILEESVCVFGFHSGYLGDGIEMVVKGDNRVGAGLLHYCNDECIIKVEV